MRYKPVKDAYEETLRTRIVELALEYGRYGDRLITQLLKCEGLATNHKCVERIWFVPNGTMREEGLKVPAKQPKRRRLWLTDGSCVRMRPECPNYVWSYDIMCDRTSDGRKLRILNVMDEYTRECLAAVAVSYTHLTLPTN